MGCVVWYSGEPAEVAGLEESGRAARKVLAAEQETRERERVVYVLRDVLSDVALPNNARFRKRAILMRM